VFQGSRGFMWITTRNGLSRFDGIEFINYYRKDGIPSNYVNNMFEDHSGTLWTLTYNGLSKYTGKGFKFYPLTKPLNLYSISPGSMYNFDKNNRIYLLASKPGISYYKLLLFKNEEYYDYSSQFHSLDTLSKMYIYYDQSSDAMVIMDKRGYLWLWKNEILKKLSDYKYDFIYTDRNKLLIERSDVTFEYKNGTITNFILGNNSGEPEVLRNFPSLNNTVDFFDGKFVNHINLPFVPTSTSIDMEGNLWFSSETNINRLLSTAFTSFSEEEINTKSIWAIAADKNNHIWFGSLYNELIEYDGKKFINRDEYKTLIKGDLSFYKGSRLLKNGELWLSTDRGVIIWDGKAFSRLKGIPDHEQICYIYEDPDNKTIMLGAGRGLYIIKNGNIEFISAFNDNKLGVIEGVTKDDDGFYWLSGHHGLSKYDGVNIIPIRDNELSAGYTYTIEKDKNGGIWVTSEEGLFFKAKASQSFIHGLPEENNKPANSIIVMDSSHILVGRVSDICIIDLDMFYSNERNYFRIYNSTDGFNGSDCLDNGIVEDKSGRFWILTSDRVVIFDPLKIKKNKWPPKLNITGFYYQTDTLSWAPLDSSSFFYNIPDKIRLSKSQNKVQITFSGISTTNPEKVTYRYFLKGYNTKWSLPANKRFVVYEKLPPGTYSFQLKAANADGIENPQPLVMNFSVIPAFWQTKLFKISAILLLLFSTAAVTFLITKKRHKRKEEKERLRTELSRLQMSSVLRQFDPHFTFNVISSVGSLIMKGEKETAYDYITKLSGLLRTVLSDGSLIIKPLSDEISFVKRYCELQKLRFKDRFSFDIKVDNTVNLQREIPKMTIQTFVENSIKHGFEDRATGGRIDIKIRNIEKRLEILIMDNGIGRVAAGRHGTGGTGYGLKIIRGLFEALNSGNNDQASIKIYDLEENGMPSGTEVKIVIPDDYQFNLGSSNSDF
jgi:ligand-binding sensor domain-containing protein